MRLPSLHGADGHSRYVEDVRIFADALEDANFWYKSPQERNLALEQKLMGQRGRRAARKSKFNVTHVTFSAWDPDRYFTWLDGAVGKYIYSPWFVLTVVLLFAFEATVFIAQWGVIGPDAKLYYNFTQEPARSGAILGPVPDSGVSARSRTGSPASTSAARSTAWASCSCI